MPRAVAAVAAMPATARAGESTSLAVCVPRAAVATRGEDLTVGVNMFARSATVAAGRTIGFSAKATDSLAVLGDLEAGRMVADGGIFTLCAVLSAMIATAACAASATFAGCECILTWFQHEFLEYVAAGFAAATRLAAIEVIVGSSTAASAAGDKLGVNLESMPRRNRDRVLICDGLAIDRQRAPRIKFDAG